MSAIAYEMRFLHAVLDELKVYLLSDNLFWNTGGVVNHPDETPYPQLTLGNLALFRQRVEAKQKCTPLEASVSVEANKVFQEIESLHQQWRTAWEKKAAQEFVSRFRQWRIYVDEVKDDPEKNAVFYSSEVRVRVLLELLKTQLGTEPPAELELLPQLDLRLRAMFEPGNFLWEDDLTPGFDQETYWYLYGRPREEEQ
ncbi:MAG: hypothetical protein JXB38_08065 [Anaerolineales bacterium]|nr:hypothetical protein [Anaerolineales bacterium]